jgi:uncharacterized protein (TIGR03067 family)
MTVFAFIPSARADDQIPSPTLKAVKHSTVYLRVTFDEKRTAHGSGFFAGEANMVLTNAHVVTSGNSDSPFPQRIEVVINSGQDNEKTCLGELTGIDPQLDLAIISVVGENLPPPLKIVSARDLEETQTVYIFGFPLGRALGKELTVAKSSITSFRKNDAGALERIQVNGGMHAGNSGGPVVDAKGQVIGVAVAGIRNTQINVAVPGDAVQDFLGGRIAGVSIGKPRPHGEKLAATVTVQLIDPLKRIQSVSLDYWLGAKGLARSPSATQPKSRDGDTARQSLSLRLSENVAKGKWTVPLPAAGQVIWAQPVMVTKSGEKRWGVAEIVRPSPPTDDSVTKQAERAADEEKRQVEARKDLKSMEGTWKLVRREVSGSLEDIDHLKLAVVIEDDRMIWTLDGNDTGLKASVELNPTITPREIDIEFNGLKQLGEKRVGIYELKGDKLVFCWNKAEDNRPKKFTTRLSIGCGAIHETYQRVPD